MTNRNTLQTLAEKIVKLVPGAGDMCFDLNVEICEALGWKLADKTECLWQPPDGGAPKQPPLYATSFDAALTLVPDDYDWIIASVNGQVGGTPYAQVGDVTKYAETAVLSLCAAALAARGEIK